MKAAPDALTSEEHEKQKHRLATLRGSIRKLIKNLGHSSKVARRTGPVWAWRVDAIREEVNKLLDNVETEEKKMG